MSEARGLDALADRLESVLAVPLVARVVSGALAMGSGAVLGAAVWLEPSEAGHGTHLQLGLGQCTFLQWTGWPCPMCGATTTFALAAELRWIEAGVNQPFAFLLFGLTVGLFAVSLSEAILPRGRWGKILARLEPYEAQLATLFLLFMGAAWAYKAWRMG